MTDADQRTNTLQLADDGGAGWSTPLAIGAAGTLRNAQCDVYGLGTSVTLAGSTLNRCRVTAFMASLSS